MNLSPFNDTAFDDDDAWEAFELAHGMAHEKIYDVLTKSGLVFNHYPLFDTARGQKDWMLLHQQEHQSIYTKLQLTGLPDLQTVDLDKQDEFEDWMLSHTRVHAIVNQTAGIIS